MRSLEGGDELGAILPGHVQMKGVATGGQQAASGRDRLARLVVVAPRHRGQAHDHASALAWGVTPRATEGEWHR